MKKSIKLLLVVLLTFLIVIPTKAQVITQDRNELENYGVTKKWKIDNMNKNNVLKTPKVDSKEKIYDFEDVLTEEEKEIIKNKIDDYMEKTGMELIILIKNLPYSYDSQNEEFATDFYDYNDFGLELNKYSGTVLFRNTYEQDPYYDFYMFGEAQLYYRGNSRNDYILDSIYDDLHVGNYKAGFEKYIDKLMYYYNQGISKDLEDYKVDENGYLYEDRQFRIPYTFVVLFSIIVTIIIMSVMISKNKMIKKATHAAEYFVAGSAQYKRREDVFLHSHTTHYTESSSSGGGGGGFHSSGGSSGGGHSSGGGRHG